MKKRITTAICILITFVLGSGLVLANSHAYCNASVGSRSSCRNTLTVQDQLSNFQHRMDDMFYVPDPYHIRFESTEFRPTVYRGTPVYGVYWIQDNFNNRTIFKSETYDGAYLNDYSLIGFGTGATAGYYPQPGKRPTSTLEVFNAPWYVCAGPAGVYCNQYYQSSEFSVN